MNFSTLGDGIQPSPACRAGNGAPPIHEPVNGTSPQAAAPVLSSAPHRQSLLAQQVTSSRLQDAVVRGDVEALDRLLAASRQAGKEIAEIVNRIEPLSHPQWGSEYEFTGGADALMMAAQYGNTAVLTALIEARASLSHGNNYGASALSEAARHGHVDAVRLLVAAGASIEHTDESRRTPMMAAARHGHADVVLALADLGAVIDSVDCNGASAMMMASCAATAQSVRLLIRLGAEVDRKNVEGKTALALACAHNNADIAQLLIDSGADMNQADNNGETALIGAVHERAVEALRVLIRNGASVNQATGAGKTALIQAVIKKNEGIAAILLDAGADPDASWESLTALDHAIRQHSPDLVELLARRHARQPENVSGAAAIFRAAAWTGKLALVQALFDAGLELSQQPRHNLITALAYCGTTREEVLTLLCGGKKSDRACIMDAHRAGKHVEANLLIEKLRAGWPRHPLGLAPECDWLVEASGSWQLRPAHDHCLFNVFDAAGYISQELHAKALLELGLQSDIAAAVSAAWLHVEAARPLLEKWTRSGRIPHHATYPLLKGFFAFVLSHDERLLKLGDAPATALTPAMDISRRQAMALLKANAAYPASDDLPVPADDEQRTALIFEEMPDMFRLWLIDSIAARLNLPRTGQ
jgi:ankyrin repeat protein